MSPISRHRTFESFVGPQRPLRLVAREQRRPGNQDQRISARNTLGLQTIERSQRQRRRRHANAQEFSGQDNLAASLEDRNHPIECDDRAFDRREQVRIERQRSGQRSRRRRDERAARHLQLLALRVDDGIASTEKAEIVGNIQRDVGHFSAQGKFGAGVEGDRVEAIELDVAVGVHEHGPALRHDLGIGVIQIHRATVIIEARPGADRAAVRVGHQVWIRCVVSETRRKLAKRIDLHILGWGKDKAFFPGDMGPIVLRIGRDRQENDEVPTRRVVIVQALITDEQNCVARRKIGRGAFQIKVFETSTDHRRCREGRLQRVPFHARVDLLDRLEGLRLFVRTGNALHFGADLDRDLGRRAGRFVEQKRERRFGGDARFQTIADELRQPQDRVALRRGPEPEFIRDPFLVESQDIGQSGPAVEERDREIVAVARR